MSIKVANQGESAGFMRHRPSGEDAGDEEEGIATPTTTTLPFEGYSRRREMSVMVSALQHVVAGERGSNTAVVAGAGEWGSGVVGGGSASSPSTSLSSSSWGGCGGGDGSSGGQKRTREEETGQLPESILRFYRGGYGDFQTYQAEPSAEGGKS